MLKPMGNASVKESIKSSLNSLNSDVSNIMTQNMSEAVATQSGAQELNISGNNWEIKCPKITIAQTTKAGVSSFVMGKLKNTTQIQSQIDSKVQNTAKQIAEAISSAFPQNASVDLKTDIETTVKNIISNNVNVNNIAQNMVSQIVTQKNNIYLNNLTVDCGPTGTFEISQFISLETAMKTITETVSKQLLENRTLNRIVQSAEQVGKAKNEQLTSLLIAIAICAIALAIAKKMMTSKDKGGSGDSGEGGSKKGGMSTETLIALFIVIVGILILLYKKNIWPFKRHYWGCIVDAQGMKTGKCEEKATIEEGPYSSKETCESSFLCSAYWGCDIDPNSKHYTGKCKQYANLGGQDGNGLGFPLSDPFSSKEECEKANQCNTVWGCPMKVTNEFPQGEYVAGDCTEYNFDAKIKPLYTFQKQDECQAFSKKFGNCTGLWYKPVAGKPQCINTYVPLNDNPKAKDSISYYPSQTCCQEPSTEGCDV